MLRVVRSTIGTLFQESAWNTVFVPNTGRVCRLAEEEPFAFAHTSQPYRKISFSKSISLHSSGVANGTEIQYSNYDHPWTEPSEFEIEIRSPRSRVYLKQKSCAPFVLFAGEIEFKTNNKSYLLVLILLAFASQSGSSSPKSIVSPNKSFFINYPCVWMSIAA